MDLKTLDTYFTFDKLSQVNELEKAYNCRDFGELIIKLIDNEIERKNKVA